MLTARFFRSSSNRADIVDFVALLQASSAFSKETAFDWYFLDGSKHPLLDIESFGNLIEREVTRGGFAGVSCVASATAPPIYVRFYQQFRDKSPLVEWSVAVDEPEQVTEAFRSPDSFQAYIVQLATAFDASIGIVYSEELLNLSHFGAFSGMDGDLVDSELAPPIARRLGVDLGTQLTSRVHPMLYDPGLIPESVGWINVWAHTVVQELGGEAIDALPWYHHDMVERLFLFQATERAPLADDVEGFRAIAALRAGLKLEAIKERHIR